MVHPQRWSTAWITPIDPSSHPLILNPHPTYPHSSPQTENHPINPLKINPSTQTPNCIKITPSTLKITIHTSQNQSHSPQIHLHPHLAPHLTSSNHFDPLHTPNCSLIIPESNPPKRVDHLWGNQYFSFSFLKFTPGYGKSTFWDISSS